MRILLIDDDVMLVRMFVRILESFGCEVCTAENEEQAIFHLNHTTPAFDCIIIDYMLNQIQCEPLLTQLKALQPDILVVLTSGFNVHEKGQQMDHLGIFTTLQKPFNTHDVSGLIQKLHTFLS
jgi:DNA-binding NtrC family response regulator